MNSPSDDGESPPYAHLTELAGVDDITAERLYEAGYQRLFHITETSTNKLQQVDGITPGLASHIKTQAETAASEDGLNPSAEESNRGESSVQASESDAVSSAVSSPELTWPMDGGDPARSYARPAPDLADIGTGNAWEFSANVSSLSSPTVAEGRVYLTGKGGIVMAVDADTGDFLWSFEMEPDHSWSGGPAVTDDTVYVSGYYGEGEGVVYALDVRDGSVRWEYETAREPSDPVTTGETVYIGYTQYHGNVVALDADTGVVKWTTAVDSAMGSPVVADSTVYVGAGHEGGHVYAIDAESGNIRWSTELGTDRAMEPIVTDDALYTGQHTGDVDTIYELDRASGHIRREFSIGNIGGVGGIGSLTYAHGRFYGTTSSLPSAKGAIYAIDVTTGDPVWSYSLGETSSPVVVGETVFVGVTDRDSATAAVYAFDAESGEIRWRQTCPGRVRSAPVVDDERLYIPTGNVLQAVNIDLRTDTQPVDDPAQQPSTSSGDPAALDAAAWPMKQGDPARTGVHPTASPPTDVPTQRWFFDGHLNQLGGRVTVRTPAVVDGTAYVSIGPFVYAVDTTDGTAAWQFNTHATNPANTAMPTVHEGTVYVTSSAQCLHALDAGNGTENWRFEVDENTVSSPVVVDDQVLFTQNAGVLHAVDTDDGTENWRFEAPSTGVARLDTPAVADGTVYIPSKTTLYAVDVTDGTEQWRFDAGGPTSFMPTVSGDRVYIGGERVVALDTTGNVKWKFSPNRWATGSVPAVDSETVYVGGQGYLGERGSDDRGVYALDPDRREVLWYHETDTVSPPVVADGTVYVGEDGKDENRIRALDADTGTERWNLNLYADSIASPAVANETIYVGCSDDGVYALSPQ